MPVRPPSLRAVAAFEAAARHASFTKAADELNLTPGAISHAIKALETRLDQRLFDRAGRRVTLTAEGQRLAARVRLSLGLLADAFDTAPWRGRDRFVVSTLSAVAERILIPMLPELIAACPGVSFDIRCSDALADLEGGEMDLALRFGPGGWTGLQSRKLADEFLFPVASPAYCRDRTFTDQNDLGDCTLIHHPESSWRLWLDPANNDSTSSASALFVNESGAALAAAAQGLGIALARGALAAPDLAAGRLVRLFDRKVAAEYAYWAVWSASSATRDLSERVAELLVRGFDELCSTAA